MLLTINQGDSDVNHRVTGEESFLHLVVKSFLDSGDITLGNRTALDDVLECVVLAALCRCNLDEDLTVLAVST